MNKFDEEDAVLYVGDLHFKVTEEVLFENFKEYGEIVLIRVCRDSVTKKSLCYAYVTFRRRYEAEQAMEDLNLSNIYGRPCRIMWFEQDPSKRISGVGNIIIKNLDETVSVKEINDTFASFGKISSCKLKTDSSGASTGCAFVNYENEDDAESAITTMDQTYLGDNQIIVEKYVVKGHRANDYLSSCYVDNCPVYLDDTILRRIFEKYGTVVAARIMLNENGSSKGFGFVSFKESKDAVYATKNLNNKIIRNKKIKVYQVSKKSLTVNSNLYINNLSWKVDDKILRELFSVFGKIVSARVMVHSDTHKSLGYGFVSFVENEHAKNAVTEMNGKLLYGKVLYVALKQCDASKNEPQRSDTQMNLPRNPQTLLRPWPMPFLPPNFPLVMAPNNFIRLPFPQMNAPVLHTRPSGSGRAKQMFGEKIYPVVCKYAGDRAGQITGKLLELNNTELLDMVDNEELIKSRVLRIVQEMGRELSSSVATAEQTEETESEEESCSESSSEEDNIEYKSMLRDKVQDLVVAMVGPRANKITETFLKLHKAELIYMTENHEYLRMKIDTALNDLGQYAESTNLSTEMTRTKQRLGEQIYPLVRDYSGDLAGKITSMLLELDNSELESMIEDKESMKEKMDEVMLQIHGDTSQDHGRVDDNNRSTTITEIGEGLGMITVDKA